MKTILNVSVIAFALVTGVYLYANEIPEKEEHYRPAAAKPVSRTDQRGAALYQKECGSCHLAYQPSFLPKRSWEKTMDTLLNHFGTDATLDPADHKTIQNYLASQASQRDRAYDGRGGAAIRITQTEHFLHEHREIPKKMVSQSEVKSFANCAACHTNASGGSYREREIRIPNYGRWEE